MNEQYYRPAKFSILPPVIKNLLIINGIFFLATYSLGNAFGINLEDYLGLHYFESGKFRIFQYITYMFMHGGMGHIFFNMFALWMFGNVLENVWGSKRFITYYMVTGIGAALIQTLIGWWDISHIQSALDVYAQNPSPTAFSGFLQSHFSGYYNPAAVNDFLSTWRSHPGSTEYVNESINSVHELLKLKMDIPIVGASGAVFGVLLAFGMMFPNSLIYVYFAIPIKAKWFVVIYGVLELYYGIANNRGDNVAHFAHLGGMIFGFFLIKYWQKKSIERFMN